MKTLIVVISLSIAGVSTQFPSGRCDSECPAEKISVPDCELSCPVVVECPPPDCDGAS